MCIRDRDYPENTLAGAEFELYADSNSNGEFDSDDVLLGMLQELTGGIYQMNDLLYGGYFVDVYKRQMSRRCCTMPG